MKRKLFQIMGGLAIFVLRYADRWINKSATARSFEQEIQDPYQSYAILRARRSIHRSFVNRGWLVLGFEEAQAVFRDPRFGSDIRDNKFLTNMIRLAADGRPVTFLDNPSLLNLDPPDHTRLRKLVAQGFVQKLMLSLEPRIDAIVNRCLDALDPVTGQYDVVTQLAKPLPAIVIAELLGLPEEDLPRFQELSEGLLGITAIGDDEKMMAGVLANEQLMEYFSGIVEYKRSHPGQDMISRLIEAEEAGDRLTPEELISTCILLLIAGHETTTRLISNGVYLLLTHPGQLAALRDDPSLMPAAIEEMLRFEPPVQLMPRFAREDLEFYGCRIKKNQLVVPVIAAANRDPAANDHPEDFNIRRTVTQHVSFGHGLHLCLGMTLARLEGRVAINALLARFPELTLAEQELVWTPIPLVRGMENLVINTGSGRVAPDRSAGAA